MTTGFTIFLIQNYPNDKGKSSDDSQHVTLDIVQRIFQKSLSIASSCFTDLRGQLLLSGSLPRKRKRDLGPMLL